MTVRIGDRTFSSWEDLTIGLRFDAIASTFTMDIVFDPTSPRDKSTFKPCKFQSVVIEHNGQRVLTGVLLSHSFKSGPKKKLLHIAGYSATGVLQDCPYLDMANGLSLAQLIERAISQYGIGYEIAPEVNYEVGVVYTQNDVDGTQSVAGIISGLAAQRHIIISHTVDGKVYVTRGDTQRAPIHTFDVSKGVAPATNMELTVNGQGMHHEITMLRQRDVYLKDVEQPNVIKNPYLFKQFTHSPLTYPTYWTTFRPGLSRVTAPEQNIVTVNLPEYEQGVLALNLRNALAKELTNIRLKIDIDGWELGGKLVTPNNIIVVYDPELYLYKPTRFFIESVDLKGSAASATATLNCVVPEVYSVYYPQNIFGYE
jgi:hypothetical protein